MNVYYTHNKTNRKGYIGMSTKNPASSYLGSGVLIKKAIKKYSRNNLKKLLYKIV